MDAKFCSKCKDEEANQVFHVIHVKSTYVLNVVTEYETGFWKVPKLTKELKQVKINIEKLMKNKVSDQNNEKDATLNVAKINSEELMMEVAERQKRASNSIILNVNNSKQKIVANKIREDKDSVKELLKDIDVDITNIRVFRLGKDKYKNRPLKVCFPSPQEALKVLQMKKEITIPTINNKSAKRVLL
ncbi:unnamed protein product [Psylliodes chrysocephalus]|uniref:Uncharacterized protein n=1 Tax=Psylliodes chrysocephalus TaxID=3402493 RepID=A0A9P0GF48_9CUCU|nr:unnamed protein product [Psylliodes chrysocephala]